MHSTNSALLPACPPTPPSSFPVHSPPLPEKLVTEAVTSHTALCLKQPATGSLPLRPTLVSVLFLKHYIKITPERILSF